MCETTNPNIPAGSMGPIVFPTENSVGSGDVIVPINKTKKKKKILHKQKPAHTVLSFDEFFKS